MKKILLALSFLVIGCSPAGTSSVELNGKEETLPEELKGLKIYDVSTGNGGNVLVAFRDDLKSTSTNYQVGKYRENAITLIKDDCNCETVYHSRDILLENDSIIILKKIFQRKK